MRSTREELIKKGVIKERKEDTIEEVTETQPADAETSQDDTTIKMASTTTQQTGGK